MSRDDRLVAGQMPDSWVMPYNPNLVVGAWVGNTGADGTGSSINAFGEAVGKTLMARLVNSLPPNMATGTSVQSGSSTVAAAKAARRS